MFKHVRNGITFSPLRRQRKRGVIQFGTPGPENQSPAVFVTTWSIMISTWSSFSSPLNVGEERWIFAAKTGEHECVSGQAACDTTTNHWSVESRPSWTQTSLALCLTLSLSLSLSLSVCSLDIAWALLSLVLGRKRGKKPRRRGHARENACQRSTRAAIRPYNGVDCLSGDRSRQHESSLEVFRMPSFVRRKKRVRERASEGREACGIKRCHCLDDTSPPIPRPGLRLERHFAEVAQDRPVVCSTDYRPFIGTGSLPSVPSSDSSQI